MLDYNKGQIFQTRSQEYEFLVENSKSFPLNIELGVYKGTSIKELASLNSKKAWFGFDSFEGLPKDWDIGPKVIAKESFITECLPIDVVSLSNVALIKGWFEDTLPKFIQENPWEISILNIDCDLYESALFGLETLNDYIVKGTLIRFDELLNTNKAGNFNYTEWKNGEWKALHEWVEQYNREVVFLGKNLKNSGIVKVTW